MSDFTKDELRVLSRALTFYVGENSGKNIQDKLRSAIHSYDEPCNHVWNSIQEPLPSASTNPEIHIANNKIICKKCGDSYE